MKKTAKTTTVNAAEQAAPAPTETAWVWSTYTINHRRFRFQGRQVQNDLWYVHVCVLKAGAWLRLSYGYIRGQYLPNCMESWALAYARNPFPNS